MTWNKKHDEFVQASNISGCSELLLRYALRRAKLSEPSEIELDLKKFNKWVDKHRWLGKYHRKTLATAIARLDERSNGMFCILKSYSPWIHKILIRPLFLVEKLQSAKCACVSKLDNVKPMFDASSKKRARELLLQNISRLDSLFQKLGMQYSQDALLRIWRMAGKKMSEVENAIEYMLQCHREKWIQSESLNGRPQGIKSPKGWLHDCLKYGWHLTEPDQPLPFFDSILALSNFVKGISPPNLKPQAI